MAEYLFNPREILMNHKAGFTLVELLVAMGVVSISLLAIIPLLLNTMGVNSSISVSVKAKDAAVMKVEELISLPRDTVDTYLAGSNAYTSPVEYITEKGVVTTSSDPAARFQRTFRIDQVPGVVVDPRPVVITSVVQYTYKGKAKSRSFSTMWSF
jgi:prepilin-type N-terminal cleavage/methylation domain-containing protein